MILDIILFLILCASVYVNWNLLRKIEVLEEANEEATIWVQNYDASLKNILKTIRELDSKKIFESDDEVGTTFDAISKTIESLAELLDNDKK
jgi:hypothetical protein